MRDGRDGRRPGDHLGRRRRRARAGRHDPARRAAARRHRGRPRTPWSARTARSRTSRSARGARVVRTHGELAVIGAGATSGRSPTCGPGTELGAGGKIGALRRDQERHDRRRRQGAAPVLRRRRRDRRGHQHRRRHDLRQLRRGQQAPHDGRPARQDRLATTRSSRRSTIGDGAATGGGTVVRRDVPPGALAVSAGPQRNIEGWVLRKRARAPPMRRGGRGRARGSVRRLTRTAARVASDGRLWGTIRVAPADFQPRRAPS